MIEFLLSVLKTLVGKIVTDEFNATCPSVAQWLVKRSAARLGADRERYEEQWLADLADRGTSIRKLIFAIGVCRAAVTLRREFVPAGKPVQTDSERRLAEIDQARRTLAARLTMPALRFELECLRDALTKIIERCLSDLMQWKISAVVAVVFTIFGIMLAYFRMR
ncbi:hypothetical protein ACFPN2_26010 [Steroidobacter flavus]|uniref:Uncharacterized protein n=1 Tax=Steroidobacter flavus TaxID=1842136 RepID=A0ABV8SZN5_9GAMM